MHRFTLLSFLLLSSLLLACEQKPKAPKESKQKQVKVLEGFVQHHYKDGSIASEINYKDKKKHGYARGYYSNGSLQGEFNYEEDLLHGIVKIYYDQGGVHKETPYTRGQIDGIQKIYRKNGSLLAEVPYKMGELGIGSKEYTPEGKLKKKLPELKVEHIDNILKKNMYVVRVSLNENSKKAKFYLGELDGGRYKGDKLRFTPSKNGVTELIYPLAPGAFYMETVQLTAETVTQMGTPYLLTTKINVAIENKGY